MAASTILTFLLLASIYFTAITASYSSSSTTNPIYVKYIKAKCSTTTYPTLCRSSLTPRAAAVRSDPWKLCNAALSISVQSARDTSSSISYLLKKTGLTKIEVAIIKECTDNLATSVSELRQSIQTMSRLARNATAGGAPPSTAEYVQFQMSNVKTWVSAAITDEGTCGDDLDDSEVRDGVKKKIQKGLVGVAKLTSNALSLINSMGYY